MRLLHTAVLALAGTALLTTASAAQSRMASHCIALAEAPGIEFLHQASFGTDLPDSNTVRLNYVAHATFLIEAPDGVTIATDYTGFLGNTDLVPNVVTMNKAHGTHFTDLPDPRIDHVLRGWTSGGPAPADHYIEVGETRIRNVPTDIRGRFGGEVEPLANSIFVFEVAGLCIAHLGHLHHAPNEEQYAALGRMDVVMAPVDGGMTLDLPTMLEVLKRSRASIVIPMHWFNFAALERFMVGMSDEFELSQPGTSSLEVSLRSLPSSPTVVLLRPAWLQDTANPTP